MAASREGLELTSDAGKDLRIRTLLARKSIAGCSDVGPGLRFSSTSRAGNTRIASKECAIRPGPYEDGGGTGALDTHDQVTMIRPYPRTDGNANDCEQSQAPMHIRFQFVYVLSQLDFLFKI
jgi:hypothetical protein